MLETKLKVELSAVEQLSKEYPRESKKARTAKLSEVVNLLEAAIKKKAPYGAGPIHLRDTIHGDVKAMTDRVTGIVGTPAKYGEAVEFGTKPHFPPVGPIQFWVEKKLGYPAAEAASVAFLIARAISQRGTKGAHMFEHTWDEKEAQVVRILEEIPDDIIRRLQQ
jgi:hypothetical protein